MGMMKRVFVLIVGMGICLMASAGPVDEAGTDAKEVAVSGGVKADAVFLNFLTQKAPGAMSELTPGGSLGGFVQIDFTEIIGIRPELNLLPPSYICRSGTLY